MLELASVFLGIVPMVVFALLMWRIDRWETEPFPLVVGAFIWGAIPSVLFSSFSQIILTSPLEVLGISQEESFFATFYAAGILAPLTEEFAKGFGVLLVFVIYKKHIHSILDGIIYGSIVGFGFAGVENIFYFMSQKDWGSLWSLFQLRAYYFGLNHAIFTSASGIGMALCLFTKTPKMRFFWPLFGLAAAMFLHFMHNLLCTVEEFSKTGFAGGLAVLSNNNLEFWFGALILYCLYREYIWISIQLDDEVRAGILTARQANDAANFFKRSSLWALSVGFPNMLARKRLLKAATKLAYAKQHCQMRSESFSANKNIQKLRILVKELSEKDPLIASRRDKEFEPKPPPLPPIRRMPPPLP